MLKKMFFLLVITALVSGVVFSEETVTITANVLPTEYKHIVAVDVMPLYIGLYSAVMDTSQDLGVESSIFGIGFQYEHLYSKKTTFAARYAYFGFGMGSSWREDNISARLDYNMNAMQFEGHARYYPGKVMFFDTTLGISRFAVDFSGNVIGEVDGERAQIGISTNASRYYLKSGVKLGWRIPAKRVIIEPAFGYDVVLSKFGRTIGEQMLRGNAAREAIRDIDEAIAILEDLIFIGGPRMYLSIGYRF